MEISLRPLLFGKARHLRLSESAIELNGQTINKSELTEFRHGIRWISGIHLTIGRIYCIDIRASNGREIRIRLRSIYGIRKKEKNDQFFQLIHYLYDHYFDDISRSYLKRFQSNEPFVIAGVDFSDTGVRFNTTSGWVKWEDLQTNSYQTYYALSSKQDPANYRAFVYLDDWNTGVLYSVSRSILQEKGYYGE